MINMKLNTVGLLIFQISTKMEILGLDSNLRTGLPGLLKHTTLMESELTPFQRSVNHFGQNTENLLEYSKWESALTEIHNT